MSEKEKTYNDKVNWNFGSDSLLKDVSRENPFTVPDNYFDKLSGKITERIAEEHTNSLMSFLERVFARPRYAVALAGFTVVVLLLIFVVSKRNDNELPSVTDITLTEVLQEDAGFFDNVDESDMVEIFFAGSGGDITSDIDALGVTDDEVIEYLSNDDIETDDLLYNL